MVEKLEKIILDTSIIVDGKISEMIKTEELTNVELIIPYAVLDELQAQASKGREPGFAGLGELKLLREICGKKKIKMRFTGDRPTMDDIRLAKSGRMDALIRDVAKTESGTLYTADYVQALVGEAEGVKVNHIPAETKTEGLRFENYFTPDTLSLHLKEDVPPMAKKGKPGKFELMKLNDEPLSRGTIEDIIREISEAARISEEGSVEIVRTGATVIQLGRYRIAIARPPFSDGLEVTIVRPVVKLTLDDYKLSEKLMKRLKERAEGIIIAGPPGSGKSTLCASLVEFYQKQGKIIKTLESPRDLQVPPEVTQYAPLEGDFEKTADILLLVRPDYSAFDEVRKTRDFEIFSDLRLAGVGMIGVVHASEAINAIQRFIGRIELGVIPHILDTVIFVKDGEIKKVYDLNLTVKVPTGMVEADLARPLVEVKDFETGNLEYEIYTFGEENVIIPVKEGGTISPLKRLASERIVQEIRKFDPDVEVELVSDNQAVVRVDNEVIARLIGKEGATIKSLEERLGIRIEVEPRTGMVGNEIQFELFEKGNGFEFIFNRNLIGKATSMFIEDQFLFSATIGKKGSIKITKESDIGKELLRALVGKKKIKTFL
ncbi:MAG: Flp pilus assembly complex ATPase component TadA [Candidatus Aenigmarchaeota archaeon]|nr:Flp pilus assembly complex ATPase component TadA [Candidatus Aenigmarchaeota archaeon]